jgi:hypothetical protein
MIGKRPGKEGVNATLVLALSGTIVALVANGPGPLRIVSGALSTPILEGVTGDVSRS